MHHYSCVQLFEFPRFWGSKVRNSWTCLVRILRALCESANIHKHWTRFLFLQINARVSVAPVFPSTFYRFKNKHCVVLCVETHKYVGKGRIRLPLLNWCFCFVSAWFIFPHMYMKPTAFLNASNSLGLVFPFSFRHFFLLQFPSNYRFIGVEFQNKTIHKRWLVILLFMKRVYILHVSYATKSTFTF